MHIPINNIHTRFKLQILAFEKSALRETLSNILQFDIINKFKSRKHKSRRLQSPIIHDFTLVHWISNIKIESQEPLCCRLKWEISKTDNLTKIKESSKRLHVKVRNRTTYCVSVTLEKPFDISCTKQPEGSLLQGINGFPSRTSWILSTDTSTTAHTPSACFLQNRRNLIWRTGTKGERAWNSASICSVHILRFVSRKRRQKKKVEKIKIPYQLDITISWCSCATENHVKTRCPSNHAWEHIDPLVLQKSWHFG